MRENAPISGVLLGAQQREVDEKADGMIACSELKGAIEGLPESNSAGVRASFSYGAD